jgi:glycosyltransferase involved in cell wall biosynthesis
MSLRYSTENTVTGQGGFQTMACTHRSPGKERILVVIPAYNEESIIGHVVAKVKESAPTVDVLVVDDHCSDATAQIARESGARVVTLPLHLGYGTALQTGFKYALENCYDYVVQMDGDGQHEPRCINDLLAEVWSDAADVALGSRFLRDCSYKAQFVRRLGMMLFGFLTSLAIRQRITDPTSGFQAFNRQVVEFHTRDGYPIDFPDADVLISLSLNGFRIKEVPVIMYQKAGKSMHGGLKPFYYVFKMLLSIFLTFFRERGYKARQ